MVCAASRSSGKSIITIGIAAAARRAKLPIRCFKKGPDFIDPLWLAKASGRSCINLDPILQQSSEVTKTFSRWQSTDGFNLVEGSMGLHDGLIEDFSDSNASLAAQLQLPVLLVVDASGMNRTVASIVRGLVEFDSRVSFKGVILNRIKSSRHEQKLCDAITEHTDLSVLGTVPESPRLRIDERELGLVPAPGLENADVIVEAVADLVANSCELDEIFGDTTSDPHAESISRAESPMLSQGARWRVAIAKDEAFQFYYADDLEELASRGVELVECSPLEDPFPTEIDGLLIGGGFPERYAHRLHENRAFLQGLSEAAESGVAIRAECAGLMVLCRSIRVDGETYSMAGVIDGSIEMQKKPVGRGYMCLQANGHNGWIKNPLGSDQTAPVSKFNAHEFHHSLLTLNSDHHYDFEYQVKRGHGIDGSVDGLRLNNVVASYAHFRNTVKTPWVDGFVDQLKQTSNSDAVSVDTIRK